MLLTTSPSHLPSAMLRRAKGTDNTGPSLKDCLIGRIYLAFGSLCAYVNLMDFWKKYTVSFMSNASRFCLR